MLLAEGLRYVAIGARELNGDSHLAHGTLLADFDRIQTGLIRGFEYGLAAVRRSQGLGTPGQANVVRHVRISTRHWRFVVR